MSASSYRKSIEWLRLTLSLTRRDYAVQFAGTALGLVWLVVQYVFQIAVFYLIFGYILAGPIRGGGFMPTKETDYLSFLLGGMALWLPISDMLLRSCGILADNRALIRRTDLGANRFIWVPVFQAMFHYLILYVPVCLVGVTRGTLAASFPAALVPGMATIMLFSGWAFILARVSVILKDITPLMRLLLQIAFWCTPIVYAATARTVTYFAYNPIYVLVELHRNLLFQMPGGMVERLPLFNGVVLLCIVSVPAFYLSSRRLGVIVSDHI